MLTTTVPETISYKKEVSELLKKIPVITYHQLTTFLISLLGNNHGSELFRIIHRLETEGTVLISKNGFVTTKNAIDIVTNGNYEVSFSGTRRISRLKVKPFFFECIQCFGIVLAMYPYSKDFKVTTATFPITFTHTARNLDYELIRIPKNLDEEIASQIKNDSTIYMEEKNQVMRERIRRIALVESDAAASFVPYYGFKFICVYDHKARFGFRIAQKREGNLWKDL